MAALQSSRFLLPFVISSNIFLFYAFGALVAVPWQWRQTQPALFALGLFLVSVRRVCEAIVCAVELNRNVVCARVLIRLCVSLCCSCPTTATLCRRRGDRLVPLRLHVLLRSVSHNRTCIIAIATPNRCAIATAARRSNRRGVTTVRSVNDGKRI